LVSARPKFEATAIKKLHGAGAIILGKANCSEWANFRAPEKSISGWSSWSAVGGQGLGIYAKNQSPAGSSSGSAVATALSLALGTEVSRVFSFYSTGSSVLDVLCY
jgi:amidase